MKTEQEEDEERKGVENYKRLEAARPWYTKIADAYWDLRTAHRYSITALGVALVIAALAIFAKACR